MVTPVVDTEGQDGGTLTQAVWADVLNAVDSSYSELVAHQRMLEERNRELLALRRSMESVLDSATDVLVVMDREGRVETASASLAALTGRRDAQGCRAADLFADPAAAEAALAEMHRGRRAVHFEAALDAPDGPAALEISLAPRIDARRRVVGAVLTGRPVGELRRAYAELEESHARLKEAQTQLVRSEKMASLGRLLAGVAHELNNPISFVYANAHALERYVSRFEAYFERVAAGASRAELTRLRADLRLERELRNLRQAIGGAREGSERVRDIVADLQRLSSDGDGAMHPTDLVEAARIAAAWIVRGGKSGIVPDFHGATELTVLGRTGHLQQVAMNLVQNATDALAGVPDPSIDVTARREGALAVLEVADNGPGVPESARGSIFDPFFTTKAVGEGTGLGLAISQKIAEEHGGRLVLAPSERGARFRLELPASADAGAGAGAGKGTA